MSYLLTAPEMVSAAATDLDGIAAALYAANAAAAGPTTGLLAAAEDEVSRAVATLFGAFGQEYQAVVTHAAAFHTEFTRALAAAASAYAQAEATASNALSAFGTQVQTLLTPLLPNGGAGAINPPSITSLGTQVAFIMGGTGIPDPDAMYVTGAQTLFIQPRFPGYLSNALHTPEQFWPTTPNLGNLTFGRSVAEGVAILSNALTTQLSTAGNSAVVYGYSQSAAIATIEIRHLMAQVTPPSPSDLGFVLTGNPNNPNGGVLQRFTGLYVPVLDVLFNGATPPDSPYPTVIYTNQYDGTGNFPQYPLNLLADLNAVIGIVDGTHYYVGLPPDQVANAVHLPTSPGYSGNTEYFLGLTQKLPLTSLIRPIPYVGTPLAELVQPDLRVLVDLGYSDYGPGLSYADIPTPASFLSVPNPFAVSYYLAKGAVQGVQSSMVSLGWLPPSYIPTGYPYAPSVAPGLNFFVGQPSVTGLSLLTGALGTAAKDLGWIPPWWD
ncbi:PE family protein [Mycobacterium kansasii]|nr:PE-PPE domain-containing protein [Mycobacterium kansasii]AGZ51634.1 PE family protein [Mycobacterium kansasii ATCC 12478]ARG62148.1 PE family protein [Mycobacterium kansasii]ARG69771.1 PE family protein [Mycobacterium kansasii]ARG75612.1 PE family protein [Mycobacterium kansasii]ARG81116.1 PE family protein [Mycobacterium kansasii]